jgi:chromosomal replication initiation ATPase DnaA
VSESLQLPLALPHRPALGGDDFLVAPCNAEAVAWLDRWPDWPAPALVLYGPAGCGKTHLASVFMEKSGARPIPRQAVGGRPARDLIGGVSACVVEDVDRGVDETGLFHLYNAQAEAGGHLLLTARLPPTRWQVRLADLRSRLLAVPAVGIGPPDDGLLAAVLIKLFADRQIKVEAEVIAFVAARIERSFAAARAVVAALDAAALAEKRAVTVPLAREVLARWGKEPSS